MSGGAQLLTNAQPLGSINSQSAVGAGAVLDNGSPRANHTMEVISSAGVTAGTVQMQGSLDNISWFNLGAAVNTPTASTVFSVSVGSTPARYVRANITSAITGGTITAEVASA